MGEREKRSGGQGYLRLSRGTGGGGGGKLFIKKFRGGSAV